MKIDIDALLLPINPDAPCGEDLSFSTEFDAIQEARREEDATLEQGEWVRDIKEADWPRVVELCDKLLAKRSKDIRVASWLAEALGKSGGFGGLADGLRIVEQLLLRFWPQIHPLPEGQDFEERIGALSWLIQRAEALVRSMPLSQAPAGAYSWADQESARALQIQMDRNPDDADTLALDNLTLTKFRAACGATPKAFYEALHNDFNRLRETETAFEQAIDVHLGADGPGFKLLRDALDDVGGLVERLAREAGVLAMEKCADADMEEAAPAVESEATAGGTAGGPIRTRAQALRQLRQVADFFRRTEPHSPVAYLADKAANWGEIPLHQWLRQVVKDGGALAHVEELLGLEGSASKNEESD